jgi:hypothetical protein
MTEELQISNKIKSQLPLFISQLQQSLGNLNNAVSAALFLLLSYSNAVPCFFVYA